MDLVCLFADRIRFLNVFNLSFFTKLFRCFLPLFSTFWFIASSLVRRRTYLLSDLKLESYLKSGH
jgi:hypothetical protein